METAKEFLIENKLHKFVDDPILFELITKLVEMYANKRSVETINNIQAKWMKKD